MGMKKNLSIVNSEESLRELIAKVREAQRQFATFTQEQVDKIFFEASMAANQARIPLAKMAVEETGMGIVEDKVIKNHYAAEYIYNKFNDNEILNKLKSQNINIYPADYIYPTNGMDI